MINGKWEALIPVWRPDRPSTRGELKSMTAGVDNTTPYLSRWHDSLEQDRRLSTLYLATVEPFIVSSTKWQTSIYCVNIAAGTKHQERTAYTAISIEDKGL